MAADIGGQDFHFPRVREGKRIHDRHGDGIRFFACGAPGAPDAQSARIAPKLFDVQFRQDVFLESLENRGIAEEAGFLGEQLFQKRFISDIGFTRGAQEFSATGIAAFAQVFANPRREEPLARGVEMNACPLFD